MMLAMKKFLGNIAVVSLLAVSGAFFTVGPVSADPVIKAEKTDRYADVDADGKAGAGETIEYTITIKNTGDQTAADIKLEDSLDTNVTLVPGSLLAAIDDAYETVGNTRIVVTAGQGVLENDMDPDGSALQVTALNGAANLSGSSDAGGAVVITSDGGFTYTPAAGYRGNADTFIYTAGDPDGNSVSARVTINLADMVWYVQNNAAGTIHDGRSASPFLTLAQAQAASLAGDTLYVRTGDGSTALSGGIVLKDNQKLIGQGVDLVVAGKTLESAVDAPTLTHTAGSVVTLANANQISGLVMAGGSGYGIVGNNKTGPFIFSHLTITDNAGDGIHLTAMTGACTVADALIAENNGTGLYVDNQTGGETLELDISNTDIRDNGSAQIVIKGGSPVMDFSGNITGSNGRLVEVANTDAGARLTFEIVGGSGGSGILIDNAAGTMTVKNATLTGTGGITINNSTGTFNFNNTTIENVSGAAFALTGGTANVTYSGNIVNATGDLIVITGLGAGGAVTFDAGTITATNGNGIHVADSAGNVFVKDYQAGTQTNPLTDAALSLTGNTGTTTFDELIAFTSGAKAILADGGGLTITSGTVDTTGSPGLDVSGTTLNVILGSITVNNSTGQGLRFEGVAGSLQVSGDTTINGAGSTGISILNCPGQFTFDGVTIDTVAGNQTGIFASGDGTLNITAGTVNAGSAAALDIDHLTLGIRLTAVYSDGGAIPGIDLDATTGSVTVTGNEDNALNGTGGTIQYKTGNAIILKNVTGVDLNRMNIVVNKDCGILGEDVTDFSMNYCKLEGNADSVDTAAIKFSNLKGNCSLLNSTVTGQFDGNTGEHNIAIVNTTGTLAPLTVSGMTTQKAFGDGFLLETRNSATARVEITDTTCLNNDSDGIQLNALDESRITAQIIASTFKNNHTGLVLTASNTADIFFEISDNIEFSGTGTGDTAIFIGTAESTGDSLITGKIKDNHDITGCNTGIHIISSGGARVCARLTGNTVNAGSIGNAFFLNQRDTTTFNLEGTAATAAAEIRNTNTVSNGNVVVRGTIGLVAPETCATVPGG